MCKISGIAQEMIQKLIFNDRKLLNVVVYISCSQLPNSKSKSLEQLSNQYMLPTTLG